MIVEIKKAKITASIMAQVEDLSPQDVDKYCVRGWCIYKGIKYIVLNDSSEGSIKKIKFWKSIAINGNKVIADDLILSPPGKFTVDQFYKKLVDIEHLAVVFGQFFI